MATWNLSRTQRHVILCNGGSCTRAGAEEVTKAIRSAIKETGIDDLVHTTKTLCNGRCEDSCVVIVYPDAIWYRKMTPELAEELVEKHLVQGEPLKSHVSHQLGPHGFERAAEAPEGMFKSERRA
ncbi:(2Fe-2S) ferredoxin domain-containing protein [Brevibacillus ruminantium]|uniref:(2Fe-2S) ferredoxin domain-containing protein n=1 Tax=Brevibacillus ruminantium TaxID=2950604 RepID=A0ABY4W875_9BACL|nr:(2Fe-2S) ferredoxin domain-containing protein [Brevibacillus ruminantium]USG63381.1 (2Fe-2S) ferredoxin domain-containing protein [Brevibacillus ruminantium]